MRQKKQLRRGINFICIGFVFFIGMPVLAEDLKVMTAEEVNILIQSIKTSEQRVHNVTIEAEIWTEQRISETDSWKRAAEYIRATSWFEKKQDGKLRIDVHSETTEMFWRDKEEFIVEETGYTINYDSTVWRVIHNHKTADGRQTIPINQGVLTDTPPWMFHNWRIALATSMSITLQGHFFNREDIISFSQVFEHSITYGGLIQVPGLEFSRELYEGIPCIRFGTKGHPSARASYWFDPNRGYALMGHESVSIAEDGTEFVNERIRITKLQEVAEGIWWPKEAIIETDHRDERKKDKPYRRTVFRAIEVTVNDSKFDESIFNVSFPAGYTVEDKINNRTYVVPETPEKE